MFTANPAPSLDNEAPPGVAIPTDHGRFNHETSEWPNPGNGNPYEQTGCQDGRMFQSMAVSF